MVSTSSSIKCNFVSVAIIFALILKPNLSTCFVFKCRTPASPTNIPAANSGTGKFIYTTPFSKKQGDEEDEFQLESLDVVLERARRRGVNPMIRLQAFLNAPLVSIITRGDATFVGAAILLDAKGFAFGLLAGKLTLRYLPKKNLPPLFVQLYPALLAIACDQII